MDPFEFRLVRNVPPSPINLSRGHTPDTMNDSHPAAAVPSLGDLLRALDVYVDTEDIFHVGLLPPGAVARTPGDRLDRAWTAYRHAAIDFKREVLRSRDLEADLQDWELRMEERSPHREESEYQTAYFAACRTAIDRRIAFAECMVNQRTIHTWRMYARCSIDLDSALEVMKRHIGYLRYEEQELWSLQFLRKRALRILGQFVKARRRICDDCRTDPATMRFDHLDGRSFRLCGGCFDAADHEDDYLAHVHPPRLRIRAPPVGLLCDLCGAAATHTFKHRYGSDLTCGPCYYASWDAVEEAATHNIYRGCGCPSDDCPGDCGIQRCGCWEGECECYKSWGRD